jgi:hypothetical protein
MTYEAKIRKNRINSHSLRRIVWSDGTSRPDDYNIIDGGQIVGRKRDPAAPMRWRASVVLAHPLDPAPGCLIGEVAHPRSCLARRAVPDSTR